MKAAVALTVLALAALASAPSSAQVSPRPRTQKPIVGRGTPFSRTQQIEARTLPLSFHNPYTGGTVTGELALPGRDRALAAVVLVTGATRREQLATASLRRYLVERGYAALTLPPVALSGATETDNLNTVAALHHLETRPDLRGTSVGLIGYGDGVPLAATAAAEGNPAAFLALLGGSIVPDHLNSVPGSLSHAALPREGAERSLQLLRCPVLIVIGEYDRQGTHHSAAENSAAAKSYLEAGSHENYTIKVPVDSDYMLAETGPAGRNISQTALPPVTVWKTTVDWLAKQVRAPEGSSTDVVDNTPQKPVRVYPKTIYGPFSFRPSMIWQPAVGGQTRPYGMWYW